MYTTIDRPFQCNTQSIFNWSLIDFVPVVVKFIVAEIFTIFELFIKPIVPVIELHIELVSPAGPYLRPQITSRPYPNNSNFNTLKRNLILKQLKLNALKES